MILEKTITTNLGRGHCVVYAVVSRRNKNDTAMVVAEFTDLYVPGYCASDEADALIERLTDYVEPGEG